MVAVERVQDYTHIPKEVTRGRMPAPSYQEAASLWAVTARVTESGESEASCCSRTQVTAAAGRAFPQLCDVKVTAMLQPCNGA